MRAPQSRLFSLVEAWTNTIVGLMLGFACNVLFLPLFGATLPISSNFRLSLIFTVLSVIRSYALRRVFNRLHTSAHKKWAWFEAWANTIVGYAVNFTAQLIMLPLFGAALSMTQNIAFSMIFVLVSVLRGYVLRRSFDCLAARGPFI